MPDSHPITVVQPVAGAIAAPAAVRTLDKLRVSVVVPAYNESEAIGITLERIAAALEARRLDFEIVVVDDGSADATVATVRALPARLRVTLLALSRNFGKEAALTAGLHETNGHVVICMDGDGQHPVNLLGPMLDHWCAGYDMVYAVRQDRHTEPAFKRWGSRLFYRLIASGSPIEIPPNAGDFRLMDRKVVDALNALPEHNRFMKGLYAWVGFRAIGLGYEPLPRAGGKSSFSRMRLLALGWTGLTGFSAMPLRLASAVGLLLAIIAVGYGIFVVIDRLFFDASIPGWPTVVASIMFFSGVQLMFVGILGEYLARVFDEVKQRPNYVIAGRYRVDGGVDPQHDA